MISVHWTPLATWDNYFVAASNAVKVGQHSGQVIGLDLLSNYFHKQLVSDRVLPLSREYIFLFFNIVFTNIERSQKTDDLPEFIQYKLRMDADTVDSTFYVEDRIPRPKPRRRPQVDLKYLYFGFSFLQVLNCTISISGIPCKCCILHLPAKYSNMKFLKKVQFRELILIVLRGFF